MPVFSVCTMYSYIYCLTPVFSVCTMYCYTVSQQDTGEFIYPNT